MLRCANLVRTAVSEEHVACLVRVTIIGELGATLAATINRRTLRRNNIHSISANVVPCLPIIANLMMEALHSNVRPKRRFLQEPHGVTSQKTSFFKATAVRT
jgi:hypothetical protein